jgi:hypothetical protein
MDVLAEIRSGRNRIKIHEDVLLPELRLQPVIKPTGNGYGIFSAIRDCDHGSAASICDSVRIPGDRVKIEADR